MPEDYDYKMKYERLYKPIKKKGKGLKKGKMISSAFEAAKAIRKRKKKLEKIRKQLEK